MIWTDENGEVQRVHHNPDELDSEKQDGIRVDTIPDQSPPEPWYKTRMVYGGSTVTYEHTDPFDSIGVKISDERKRELYNEIKAGDFEAVMATIAEMV